MVAGFVAGYTETKDFVSAFKKGIATGSASAFSDNLATKEEVEVLKLTTDGYGKLEIHLVDNCYIPERDLDYVFLTFDECAEACKKHYEKQLEKLREMLKLETQDRSSL